MFAYEPCNTHPEHSSKFDLDMTLEQSQGTQPLFAEIHRQCLFTLIQVQMFMVSVTRSAEGPEKEASFGNLQQRRCLPL